MFIVCERGYEGWIKRMTAFKTKEDALELIDKYVKFKGYHKDEKSEDEWRRGYFDWITIEQLSTTIQGDKGFIVNQGGHGGWYDTLNVYDTKELATEYCETRTEDCGERKYYDEHIPVWSYHTRWVSISEFQCGMSFETIFLDEEAE